MSVSLLTGARTEEVRALTWPDIDLTNKTIGVYRSVRVGGDVKTKESRRLLRMPDAVVEALKEHNLVQARERMLAGSAWQENDLVFASAVGTPLDASHVRRAFKNLTEAAGLGRDWTPRECRHSFVSIMSEADVALEDIARLVGHSSIRTTEDVYRKPPPAAVLLGDQARNDSSRCSMRAPRR